MKTSIIILTYNKLGYTKLCVESIRKYTEKDSYEIIIVDNNSTDGTIQWIEEQNDIKAIYNKENKGFPRGCNQGIKISTGDNILLLNNDTIVTYNWLSNLTNCLYSSDDIAAVGPVTNNCSYFQTIAVEYKSTKEMLKFVEKNNVLNANMWEERLKLIGFCILIKRKVIDEIGFIDEIFTPGNFEDDDYCCRIRKSGYRLILCKDSFIHHFGSVTFKDNKSQFGNLLYENKKKFIDKWGFDIEYSSNIRFDLINFMYKPIKDEINVLDIGCACGGTLLQIKNIYKKANLYGIEINENAAFMANNFADIKIANIENLELNYEEGFFDYIIMGDIIELLHYPNIVLSKIKKYLKDEGQLIASISNSMNYSVIYKLNNGDKKLFDNIGTKENHFPYLSLSNIKELFNDQGYMIEDIDRSYNAYSIECDRIINSLNNLTDKDLRNEYKTNKFILKAIKEEEFYKKQNISFDKNKVELLIKRIDQDSFVEESSEELVKMLLNAEVSINILNKLIENKCNNKEKIIRLLINKIENNQIEIIKTKETLEENKPLVSILIPAYNRVEYLELALNTALNQTYKNIEVVICDDSSEDTVEKMITEKFIGKYKNLRYYRNKENLGQFENDLKLFGLAKGDYINYLMDDDVFELTKIEKMMKYFISDVNEEIKLITSHRQMINEHGEKLSCVGVTEKLFDEDTLLDGIIFGNFVLINNYNCIGEPTTVLFRKKDLKEPFGTFNKRKYGCNVDMATWLNLLAKGKMVYIAETLSYFRIHPNQQLNSDKMILLGNQDYAHEILTAREKGFLQDKNDYMKAISNCERYCSFILDKFIKSGLYNEESLEELKNYHEELKSRFRLV
ncbi:glycosyltransferase [Clostridium grantii]|uniref:Glycosyltransferase, GT2 family n=1 Tax=Clostridium grantii DSM 8605 TaxID=1121316 RepID=A0A1M5RNY6_9CLOT|nr:glycosyltransferase [Clostridium grantii]SHH28014.1 Glycosyltransferase, GT2 family [Clostridium grantii DSM 8605]